MKSLLVYLKEYKKESYLAPLFKMLEATFELIVPLVMARVIDVGIRNSDVPYIIKMCLVLVAFGICGLASSITAQYFAAKAATGFATKVRHVLFSKIQEFTYSQLDKFGTDTLVTRMTSDINQLQSGVNLALRLFLRSPFIVFGAMIMAFTVDSKSAMIFVVTIPVLAVVVFGIMLTTIPLYAKVQSNLDKIMTSTRENLCGVRVIRAFNIEKKEKQKFEANNEKLNSSQQFVGRISGLMNPLTYVIVNLATVYLLYKGAIRIDKGVLTSGQLIALLNYMSQILIELIKLANLIIQLTKAVACGNRIEDILKEEPNMKEGSVEQIDSDNEEIAVEFKHVSLRYDEEAGLALEDISFSAKKGQTIGIIGGTGSGKSSLVNLIPRFYDVNEGSVNVFGNDVKEYKSSILREKIGMVLQKAELFAGTIEENLRWGNQNATKDDIERALDISQAKEYVQAKKDNIKYFVEQNGRNLSGGQKQRLTIARALMKNPEILILDDSASALDFATDAKLRMAIKTLKNNLTTFIVSQRAASVQYADLILVLDDGKIVGQGTHDELIKTNEIYQEIYYSQFPKEEVDG
ncbi:ABC transporter ATP-binding protein [Lachnobacterium bovis]|jgi:ABC-type multidrug transport system fused ATPase/permease subunit|uniref:ABC-type multidrug transport system, ATPase and permease component n=1 Tax=Lachnobacterium bovis DSM 14045 TaxID=1122142 RepID=A0A1H3J4Q7_9FIRM|nr:ABC transporter ATP-binding protein [Lachnobacterium bovis]MBQ1802383.1 ABC transporter ATP-binding protein [Lachnobacterium sp.]SDY34931.1 ABC-type multidrug transport system, ATPase and permease component [Lachnobacterium bovis DSM 14045]